MTVHVGQPHWQRVITFARQHECDWAIDPTTDQDNWGIHRNDPPPFDQLLGPVFERGPAAGLVQVGGNTVCEWGPVDRADMTFSVTKTYLAVVAGLAFDSGLLPDPDEPVCRRLPGIGFDDDHNRQITWTHLLQFTSEWQGSCFGIPDWVDHNRRVALQPSQDQAAAAKGTKRALHQPGTYWEYNDIRMNQFSRALLHLFERALPDVFHDQVMAVVGASDGWRWHGYRNSWENIGGKELQSVPGGGHWGGGMQISARDQALVGQLLVNDGQVGQQQVLSSDWIRRMRTPCDIAPFYGYFTWLNTDARLVPNASESSFFAFGVGGQTIWHDPTMNLVAVFRWTDASCLNALVGLINEALATDHAGPG